MSTQSGWIPLLSRLSEIVLSSGDLKHVLTAEAISKGWCGRPAASENEILSAEERLGLRFPPSYRSFLMISNGWRPFDGLIEQLFPVQEVDRYFKVDPDDLALLQECYLEDDVKDEDYLDYQTPRNVEIMRHRYYPNSLLIGRGWGPESERILLNPQITFQDDEWETIYFANWIPGNHRYCSFRNFVEKTIKIWEEYPRS